LETSLKENGKMEPGALEKARNEAQKLMTTPTDKWLGKGTQIMSDGSMDEGSLEWTHDYMDMMMEMESLDLYGSGEEDEYVQ
jgi:hypothetical protein